MTYNHRQLALMSMFIALNIAIGGVVQAIKLPIFLDAIGTILGTLMLGPLAGIVIGVSSFLLTSVLVNPVYVWFVGTQAAIALAVHVAASRFAAFRDWRRAVVFGMLLGVIAGACSAPVIVAVFGGISGSGRDLITAALLKTGSQISKAVFLSGAASEPIDKTLQVLAAYFIVRALPRRLLAMFRNRVLERNGLF